MNLFDAFGYWVDKMSDTPRIKNKALLDTGEIVEYDECCKVGFNPLGHRLYKSVFLGTGIIYEVQGVKQVLRETADRCEFFRYEKKE